VAAASSARLKHLPLGTNISLMNYIIQPMSAIEANIIAEWRYEGVYSFYDIKADKTDYEELMTPTMWGTKYFAVYTNKKELIGYFCFEKKGELTEMGLGLSPQRTGQRYGLSFVEAGVKFQIHRCKKSKIILSVAAFNKRAIKVYERAGFQIVSNYLLNCNGKDYEFLRMELKGS
jgi:[ribosomal protein S18]-alanine N-acetyltransferase